MQERQYILPEGLIRNLEDIPVATKMLFPASIEPMRTVYNPAPQLISQQDAVAGYPVDKAWTPMIQNSPIPQEVKPVSISTAIYENYRPEPRQIYPLPNQSYDVPKQRKFYSNKAQAIADAIGETETGSIPNMANRYTARGGSGENGRYQFMPGTWKAWSTEFARDTMGLNIKKPLPLTPENQDSIVRWKVQQWLDSGLTPEQVAAKWNSGSPFGWENKIGTNKMGVKYNVPAYVNKFKSFYNQLSQDYPDLEEQGTQTPLGAYNPRLNQWGRNVR